MARKVLSAVLVALTALAVIPYAASAAPVPAPPGAALAAPKVETAGTAGGVSALEADLAPEDAYEPDGDYSDIPWASLRDLNDELPRWDVDTPGWGIDAYTESHTIDLANVTQWDEDWFKLTVTDADFDAWTQLSYRFDAFSQDRSVDLVLDVYADFSFFAGASEISGADPAAIVSNDDTWWGWDSEYDAWGRWSSVMFEPPSAGIYWIRVRPYYSGPIDGFTGHAGTYEFRAKYGQVERLSGADRISTAIRISQEGWPTMPARSQDTTVVLAFSKNYPDALAAASLAGACGSPILLTAGDALPAAVAAEITRLGFKSAYVVGGPAVIQDGVLEDLGTILGDENVWRIWGEDRYETAAAVLEETALVLDAKGEPLADAAFLVSGKNFPDALAVGPMSYFNRVPILLTNPTELNPWASSAIAAYAIDDVIVAGGTAAVSQDVVNGLIDDGIPPNRILRVAGVDRYETAKEIAAWACDMKGPGVIGDGLVGTTNNPDALSMLENPYLNAYASGKTYPDALAGGAFAGKAHAPILLTPNDATSPFLFGADGEVPVGSTTWFSDLWNNGWTPIGQSYLLGGEAAVSEGVFVEIDNNTGESGAP